MEWFRVESVFPESDKVEKLERLHTRLFEKAITMWVFAGCFCSRNSTDGRISERQLARLVPTIKRPKLVIAALKDSGLIEPDATAPGSLTMHDYLDYNPSKAEKEKWREDNRRRQQDLRDRRSNALRDKESNGVTNGVTNGKVTEGRNGSPFRTGPVRTGPNNSRDSGSEEPSTQKQIEQLEVLYTVGVAAAAREACALSRKNGKMTDSVWLRTLNKLATYPKERAEEAMVKMAETYGDGEKDEQYMIGIARKEKRRHPIRQHIQPPNPVEQYQAAEAAKKAANEK